LEADKEKSAQSEANDTNCWNERNKESFWPIQTEFHRLQKKSTGKSILQDVGSEN
jgi:hypothetical protein